MNSQDTHTLELLLDREQSELDAATLAMHQAERHLMRVDGQVAQFERYRADYVTRWQGEFRQQGGVEILHCYRGFMHRLDDAVTQLAAQQVQAQASVRRSRKALIDTQTRVAAIRKLIERRVEAHELLERRREQKHTDEIAQRAGRLGLMPQASLRAAS